jgi:Protein of unknown function (DUF3570)
MTPPRPLPGAAPRGGFCSGPAEPDPRKSLGLGGVLAAALLLPGVMAHAETAPEQGVVSLKMSSYRDWQPGLDRVKVDAPSIYVLAPIDAHWTLEGSAVNDAVSGASPRFHSAISGASKMDDSRTAGDLKLTHYADRQVWAVGVASSGEHDYRSNTLSGEWRLSSEDNNRTWNLGLSYGDDAIGSTNDPTLDEHRRTWQLIGGVTQALTPVDLVQLSLGATFGRGYFNDPYKFPDARPDKRNQRTALLRWNHHVDSLQATLRTSWRIYDDSYGVRAHTLDAAWVQPVAEGWTLTPMLRYTTQRAANFYYDPVYDPVLGAPFPPGFGSPSDRYHSADQRLSAFGAATVGLRVDWAIDKQWKLDLGYERYEQRAAWRVGGDGSPGLAAFSARWWQLGVSRSF